MVQEVLTTYRIASHKLGVGGMSAAGTGAVRYVQYCYQQSTPNIKPIGVFGVDVPLNYERLYRERLLMPLNASIATTPLKKAS